MKTSKKIIRKILHLSIYKVYSFFIKKKSREKPKKKPKHNNNGTLSIGKSEKYNLTLIHNPKAAGTSLMDILERPIFYNHQLPCRRYNKEEWENNKFLLVVRHPIDRLVSAFYFHTGDFYQGGYTKLFPNLKSITSLYQYFKYFSAIENTITPQYNYTFLPGSDKKIDIILKFENLEGDLLNILNIHSKLPKKNISPRSKKPTLTKEQLQIILSYYNEDFKMFNYSTENYQKYIDVI